MLLAWIVSAAPLAALVGERAFGAAVGAAGVPGRRAHAADVSLTAGLFASAAWLSASAVA